MTPIVSVGIPTYNRSRLLRQTILSVLQQTEQNFEIVVSDDHSTDDTAQVVKSFKDRRIRYHRTATNLRPPRNWNECVRLATGEFFALLPDDDVYCPTWIAGMVQALDSHPGIGFAQCALYSVDEQLRCLGILQPHSEPLTLVGDDALVWQLTQLACAPAALLFRRSAMLKMGLWREDYWDDWAFIIRLAYRFGFTYVPQLLACNRVHEGNLNQVLRQQRRDSILDLINQEADVFSIAIPATPRLIALRAKLDRQLSQHCMLLALGALRRRDFGLARFHLTRAHHLYALAGFDLGFICLWLTIRRETCLVQRQRDAARSADPILHFETMP